MDCDFWKSIGIAKHFRWNFSGTMGPSQWRQVIIITRGHLCLLHPFKRDIQIGFSVGWYTQENNLERNPKFACGRMYDDHGESAKEQIKPDICQTPFHQKYFRENNSVPFLETKHVPQKTGNNLGHKVRNCVSPLPEHSWVCISVGKKIFPLYPYLGGLSFTLSKRWSIFFKWCDGNVFWQGTILRVFRWFLVQAASGFDCCPEPGKQCDGHMVASLGATIGFVGFPMVFRSEVTIGFDCLFWLSTVGQTMRCSSLPQTYFV